MDALFHVKRRSRVKKPNSVASAVDQAAPAQCGRQTSAHAGNAQIAAGAPRLRRVGVAQLPPKVPPGSRLPQGAIHVNYARALRQGEYMIRLDAVCIHTGLVPRPRALKLAADARRGARQKVQFVNTEDVRPAPLSRVCSGVARTLAVGDAAASVQQAVHNSAWHAGFLRTSTMQSGQRSTTCMRSPVADSSATSCARAELSWWLVGRPARGGAPGQHPGGRPALPGDGALPRRPGQPQPPELGAAGALRAAGVPLPDATGACQALRGHAEWPKQMFAASHSGGVCLGVHAAEWGS